MGLGKKNTTSFFSWGWKLSGGLNIIQKYDLVPVAIKAHSGLDCGQAWVFVFFLLSFQVALKGK